MSLHFSKCHIVENHMSWLKMKILSFVFHYVNVCVLAREVADGQTNTCSVPRNMILLPLSYVQIFVVDTHPEDAETTLIRNIVTLNYNLYVYLPKPVYSEAVLCLIAPLC